MGTSNAKRPTDSDNRTVNSLRSRPLTLEQIDIRIHRNIG
jgi:hypothetical protein